MSGLPGWVRHTARVRPVPVDRALVARGALGMLVPLALGQAAGRPDLGAAAALGAYGAAVDDSAAPWRTRALVLVLPQLGGALGLALGGLTGGRAWAQILLVAAVALVSGLLSAVGPVSDVAALVLLLATVMGLGLPTGPPWWQVPALFLVGGLPLVLLSLADALRRPGRAERSAVAEAVRAVADLVDADDATWAERRHAVTRAMDTAHEAVVARRVAPPRAGTGPARLAGHLDTLVAVIAATPAPGMGLTARPGTGSRADQAQVLRRIADAVETGTAPSVAPEQAPRDTDALQRAVTVLAGTLTAPPGGPLPRIAPPPAPLRRLTGATAAVLRDPVAWGSALRLATCMAVAQAVASWSGLPHSGWLVLTVALVVRPTLGTVPARLLLRALGTTAGVLIGLAATTALPAGWWRIAALVVLTGLLQAYARRSYALQTLFLTPVMVLLADPLGQVGSAVPEARLLDTAVGCALAFVLGHLLWPENTRARVPHRLAAAHDTVAAYAEQFLRHPDDRHALDTLRRHVHRDLHAVDTELARLRTDPRHAKFLSAWHTELAYAQDAMRRLGTAAALSDDRPDPRAAGETHDLAVTLRRRATNLRSAGPGS